MRMNDMEAEYNEIALLQWEMRRSLDAERIARYVYGNKEEADEHARQAASARAMIAELLSHQVGGQQYRARSASSRS